MYTTYNVYNKTPTPHMSVAVETDCLSNISGAEGKGVDIRNKWKMITYPDIPHNFVNGVWLILLQSIL